MKHIGIIPARMESSRFPGKPLEKIAGIPMVGHCWFRSKMSKLDEVFIATCNREIFDYAEEIGAQAIMTSNTHERASERVAEAVSIIEQNMDGGQIETVSLIQGDEPLITPEMINLALDNLLDSSEAKVVNLASPLNTEEAKSDLNEVKVAFDKNGFAMFFSRSQIPAPYTNLLDTPVFRQVCVIPFERDFLYEYESLEPTPLEIAESIDMLRILEHGSKIKIAVCDQPTVSVDTKSDLMVAEQFMRDDKLVSFYR